MLSKFNRIKTFREAIGLSQKELAENSNCSISAIGNYEIFYRYPQPQIQINIYNALKKNGSKCSFSDVFPDAHKCANNFTGLIKPKTKAA